MAKVIVTKSKLDALATSISTKSGASTPMTIDQMKTAVDSISGGGASATKHTIHLEFTDSTDINIDVYYDDALIGTMINAYIPSTYGGKTVTLAQLDGVTWYEVSGDIPLNTELVDYTAVTGSMEINDSGQAVASDPWFYVSDYTAIDPSMTFTFIGAKWCNLAIYDSSKTFVRAFAMSDIEDSSSGNVSTGTLSGSRITNGYYVRITATGNTSSVLSLIRTA